MQTAATAALNDQTWPMFSVITPSYNQGAFIEQTIQSVLQQNYPNFEHIVIDGASTDNTVDVLKKYSHLQWVSEKDRGQADALNKGLSRAQGEIVAWINSDDWYEPGIFHAVAKFFRENPDKSVVMGDCNEVDQNGRLLRKTVNTERGFDDLQRFWRPWAIPTQPAIFFRRKLIDQCGYLDETLYYAMDYDLWLRFARQDRFYHLDQLAAWYRFHPQAKGGDQDWSKFVPEWKLVRRRYVPTLMTRLKQTLRHLFTKQSDT